MKKAKLFQNGQSQAVRLPREFRFKGDEVYIKKSGDIILLLPISNPWQSLLDSLDQFSEDFLQERHQPQQQNRDDLF